MQEPTSQIHKCPNCDYEYLQTQAYCANCGQETHLHEDSFKGLAVHFIAHYFHYESSFRVTLKTLWLQPGALTVAYIQKQRARYLSPITLYIFISVVYFIIASLSTSAYNSLGWNRRTEAGVATVQPAFTRAQETTQTPQHEAVVFFKHMVMVWEDDDYDHALEDKFMATLPKVFFFMLPLLAFVLQLLFYRRTDMPFATHAVAALHFHSFYFTISIFEYLVPQMFVVLNDCIAIAVFGWCFVYMYQLLRRVYRPGRAKAFVYAVVAWPLYYALLWFIMVVIWFWLAG